MYGSSVLAPSPHPAATFPNRSNVSRQFRTSSANANAFGVGLARPLPQNICILDFYSKINSRHLTLLLVSRTMAMSFEWNKSKYEQETYLQENP
jgi:hypothetical protein